MSFENERVSLSYLNKKRGVLARSSCIEVHVHLTCSMFISPMYVLETFTLVNILGIWF